MPTAFGAVDLVTLMHVNIIYNGSYREHIFLQDFQRYEEERSDYLKDHFLKYIGICVAVNEASAEVCA